MAVENDVLMKLGVAEASSLSSAWSNIGGQMSGLVMKAGVWGAGLLSVGAIVKGLYEGFKLAAKEYMETADAAARMAYSVELAARAHPILQGHVEALSAVMRDQAKVLADNSMLTSAEVMNLQRQAMNYGILADRIDDTIRAALDFSAATGTDVHTAMQRLAQASNGVYLGWKRWGITVDEGKTSLENFDGILRQVNERFGGATRSEMSTYEAQVKQVDKAWNDMFESAGNKPARLTAWFRQQRIDLYNWVKELNLASEGGTTGFAAMREEAASRAAAAAAVREQAESVRKLADEESRLSAVRARRKAVDSEQSGWMQKWANEEKKNLQDIIELQKELGRVTDQQENKAKENYSRLARERGMMSRSERTKAEAMYANIEQGGLGAWEGMTSKNRQWYAGTAIGQQQLAQKGIFEAQTDRDAGWMKQAAGATKVQIQAAIKNELIVKVGESDKETADAMVNKVGEELKKYLDDKKKRHEAAVEIFMKGYAEQQAASAGTGGNR